MDLIILQASTELINPIIMLLGLLVVWLFFIRPSAKKAKQEEKFIEDLQKGKEVVTKSGLIGKISKIEGKIITLQVDTKTFIRLTRGAISKELTDSVLNEPTETK